MKMIDVDKIPDRVPLNSEEGMRWWQLCRPKMIDKDAVLDLTPLKELLRSMSL